MKPKATTQWFGPEIKPVRIGVYQTRHDARELLSYPSYQHWNGEWWGFYGNTLEIASRDGKSKSSFQYPEWRGLAEEPK